MNSRTRLCKAAFRLAGSDEKRYYTTKTNLVRMEMCMAITEHDWDTITMKEVDDWVLREDFPWKIVNEK